MLRRTFIAGSALLAAGCTGLPVGARRSRADFAGIRASLGTGARLGVAAIDTAGGRTLLFDEDSRYAMCSTCKAPIAAAVLAEADSGRLSLAEELSFRSADILSHSPVTEANVGRGRMRIDELCRAMVGVSDNGATNLILRRIGGPEAVTRFVRSCGDSVTRLDRYELELNTNLPDDPRDTTSPAAMAGLLRTTLFGDMLKPDSRALLASWMEAATTGLDRLRAGIPAGWRAGDKTGTGANGAHNDIAFVLPPGRPPILIASYISGGDAPSATRARAHAHVARQVVGEFA